MNNCSQKNQQHRNAFRTMLNHQVRLLFLDDAENIETFANCRDVSECGLALEVEHPVETGQRLRVHFEWQEENPLSISDCEGIVLRCTPESNELYLLAVKITDYL
ncbi:PilZ domain-containing protein [Thalassotalea aquiviva]|uniref:PilZ domain-containing protein n=1 Tax=Thalassotalea aquiviva TaxID=3242415 RepID=UPI00352A4D56